MAAHAPGRTPFLAHAPRNFDRRKKFAARETALWFLKSRLSGARDGVSRSWADMVPKGPPPASTPFHGGRVRRIIGAYAREQPCQARARSARAAQFLHLRKSAQGISAH